MNVKLKVSNGDLNLLPKKQTMGAACEDLVANESTTILPHTHTLVGTGLFMEIPIGWEYQIRPRSGLAYKHGITVLNSPGTIDSDYRGEVKVMLINHSDVPFVITKYDRIAQGALRQVEEAEWELVDELEDSDRGVGGFGHTGV